MLKIAMGLLIAVLPVTIVQAQSMSVSTFLVKSEALKKKGPFALMSGDLKLLKAEVSNSARAYAADVRVQRKSGKFTHGCPPAGSQLTLNSKELLDYFGAIPPTQRRMSVKSAFYNMMKTRYPCPSRGS